MRNFRATQNLLAVSANLRETAINTEQTLDLSLLVDQGDVLDLERRRENNQSEMTGKEEPDTVYDLGNKSMGKLTFNKAQPQHFAFIMGYGLGSVATAAAGATGYQHTCTPIANDLDLKRSNPSFTGAMRYGDTVLKRRFASLFIDSFTASFSKDDWCKINASLKGTGKVSDNITEETVSALDNALSLTLAANAVQGGTAQARLDNVQAIKALYGGVWVDVTYSAVSAATPAVITITSVGGAGAAISYKVLYIPTEPAWCTFPSRVAETPLRVAQCTFNMGGAWGGAAFTGGRTMSSEVQSLEWTCNNGLEIDFVMGAGDAYADRCFRPQRTQTLKVNREFRDYIMQQHIDDNDTFGAYLLARGALYEAGHYYEVELIFPKLGILSAPLSVDGKRLAEAGDLIVLQDDTYGSVIARVKNLQATYAA
jgi:hypothetical protein